ncbi:hypothetical protein CAter10_2706 [Collimonas arenae]|nr:hypothetical protein CAter10_2706 [Collimonas arenae]
MPHQKTRLHDYFMNREIISGLRSRQQKQAAKAAGFASSSDDNVAPY